MEVLKYLRGQIWWANLDYLESITQRGKRPVIIISNNLANRFSGNVTVIPLTTQIKRLDIRTHLY